MCRVRWSQSKNRKEVWVEETKHNFIITHSLFTHLLAAQVKHFARISQSSHQWIKNVKFERKKNNNNNVNENGVRTRTWRIDGRPNGKLDPVHKSVKRHRFLYFYTFIFIFRFSICLVRCVVVFLSFNSQSPKWNACTHTLMHEAWGMVWIWAMGMASKLVSQSDSVMSCVDSVRLGIGYDICPFGRTNFLLAAHSFDGAWSGMQLRFILTYLNCDPYESRPMYGIMSFRSRSHSFSFFHRFRYFCSDVARMLI